MITAYLASRFSRKEELRVYAQELQRSGVNVSSRWLTGQHDWTGTPDEHIPCAVQAEFAQQDLDDIDQANVLIFFCRSAGHGRDARGCLRRDGVRARHGHPGDRRGTQTAGVLLLAPDHVLRNAGCGAGLPRGLAASEQRGYRRMSVDTSQWLMIVMLMILVNMLIWRDKR